MSAVDSDESTHHARLGEHAVGLWKRNHMTDIIVQVCGQSFRAHRAVLTCYSPYFKRVLPVDEPSPKVVELRSVTAEVFDVILTYMYTGKLALTCQNLAEVYRVSRHLEIREIMKRCLEVLSGSPTDPRTIVYVYCAAKKLSIRDTCHRALSAMANKFEEVIVLPDFMDLAVDQLCEVLSVDLIATRGEIVLFLATLKWLHHDFLSRELYAVEVLGCIRFSLMSPRELLACFHPPLIPGIAEYPAVRLRMLNALCYLNSKDYDQESKFNEFASQPRIFLYRSQPFNLWDNEDFKEFVPYIPPETKSRPLINPDFNTSPMGSKSMDFPAVFRDHFVDAEPDLTSKEVQQGTGDTCSASVIQTGRTGEMSADSVSGYLELELKKSASGMTEAPVVESGVLGPLPDSCCILASGGLSSEPPSGADILRYCPAQDRWETCGKLPAPRHHHSLVHADNGKLYLVGGCDTTKTLETGKMAPTRSCYRYDIFTKEWLRLRDMNHPRVYHGVAVLYGCLYVVGGRDDTGRLLASIEYYISDINVWTELKKPLCCPRMAMGVAVFQGMMWVVGGMIQPTEMDRVYVIRDVECFNPRLNRWIFDKPKLPSPRSFCSLVECGDHLFVIGGTTCVQGSTENYFSSVPDVFRFDADTNRWVSDVPLPYPAHGMAVSSCDDTIYVMGGLSTFQVTALNDVLCMSLSETQWTSCRSLPLPNSGLSTTVLPQENDFLQRSGNQEYIE